ncbi:aldose 1-epimerase [Ktedonosporobacter rubrisoli]|uniref:Aldose 1-epimerase n=1 Tax=Ktedonosporobacter rubrisoli TaxID=2509675 RepID=A0A4P6JT65_KTERU|nr:aldose 1-epimerase [Ktedonosporobacter rubrisoli]QBD78757.1 aldose 1-epimerase [Ktedonosporobacter rubrisoli]
MTFEPDKGSASAPSTKRYAADIRQDPELHTTVIELSYHDPANPARNLTVAIAPDLGSNMFSFRVGSHDLIYCEHELLKRKDFTGNFVLWPLPNRIRDKRYTYQGQNYSLADIKRQQGNAVLIHGLVFDRPWQYMQPIVEPNGVHVTTFIEINEESPWYAAYPFDSKLTLTYSLDQHGLSTTYTVYNRGARTLPFGFALHPYFSLLSGKDDTLVSVPADQVMEADDELLPTGRIFPVDKIMYAMYDLRQPTAIGNLQLDHVYTSLHPHEPAIIDYRKNDLQLYITATEDFTHAVIYTPQGQPYFCLEHQTCSTDAINLHNQGPELQKAAHLLEVPAGKAYSGTLRYTIRFGK